MWQQDIHANLLSVAAAEHAETDEPVDAAHAYDLPYACQDAKAKDVMGNTVSILDQLEQKGDMGLGNSSVPRHRLGK